MYIFEIIAKFIRNRKIGHNSLQEDEIQETYEDCEHIYLAIDSTKDYLACNKCGHVIKNTQKPEKKNIFKI